MPTVAFLRQHHLDMDRKPFDGVVIDMRGWPSGGPVRLAHHIFVKDRFDRAWIADEVNIVRGLPLKNLKHNCLVIQSVPADLDWFSDAHWEAVAHNFGVAAWAAKGAGLEGFMLDTEQYVHRIYAYNRQPARASMSYEEYAAVVRKRGRQVIDAINADYSDITIMLTYGYGAIAESFQWWSLLLPFLDGMLEGCRGELRFVNGYEQAYMYNERSEFLEGYHSMWQRGAAVSLLPRKYRQHVQAGFGVWLDTKNWHPEDISLHYRSPQEFRDALHEALDVSDRYVWLYSELQNWWTGENAIPAYEEAVRQAREFPHSNFGVVMKSTTSVLRLTQGWRFAVDVEDQGQDQGWYAVDFDDSAWQPIEVESWWEDHGVEHDGIAWYRTTFTIPAELAGKKLYLYFFAVDESAWVYVNGKHSGSHDIGPPGWTKPFVIEITGEAVAGASNTLAVRVLDTSGKGGIWGQLWLRMQEDRSAN